MRGVSPELEELPEGVSPRDLVVRRVVARGTLTSYLLGRTCLSLVDRDPVSG